MPSISGLSTQIRAANPTDLEDYQDPALGAAGSRKIATFDAHGQFRNALVPRGGVAFDGSANSRLPVTLTGQPIGPDPVSVAITLAVPAANPTASCSPFCLSGSATVPTGQTNALLAELRTTGDLWLTLVNTSGSDYVRATLAGFVAQYGGKAVHVAVVRPAAGNLAVYVNGVALSPTLTSGGGAATWQTSLATAYFNLGYQNTTEVWSGNIYGATLYNLALSAADVQEIHELGGAVPERFKWGTQVLAVNENWDAGADGWSANLGAVFAGSKADLTASGNVWADNLFPRLPQRTIRVRFDYATATAGMFRFPSYNHTPSFPAVNKDVSLSGTGTFDQTFAVDGNLSISTCGIQLSTIGWLGTIDNLKINYVGAVAHYTCDEGLGFQLLDASSNRLHATISPTGIAHLAARRSARIRFSTATAGNQQLLGQQALPAGARLRSWVIDSAGTPTVTLGRTSGGAELCAAAPLAAGLNDLALLSRFASTNNLYVNSTTTDLLQHTIDYDLAD